MASKFRQEMPPPGGYGPVEWDKAIKSKRMSGFKIFGIMAAVSVVNLGIYAWDSNRRRLTDLDMKDGRIALEPLIMAERSRMAMRRLRANRDEERELMKNVPGWEVGTFFGEPVFHNVNQRFCPIPAQEYYAHSTLGDTYDRLYEKRKH